MDPLLDLIHLLRPQAALFGAGFDASGEWSLAFRRRNDLLFCWVERGACLLLRSGLAPVPLQQGDFALIFTSSPFTLASDTATLPLDSETAVAAAKNVRLKLGSGEARPITLHAGKFLVERANETLLAGLFPPLIHISSNDASLGRVRSLLTLSEMEARQPGPASEFIVTRLVELILVEILRTKPSSADEGFSGLLAGLADPVTASALTAMHRDVARDWTVNALAKLCGVSRSTFAAKFRNVVGTTPIDYLLQWRMAFAKDQLSRGTSSVNEIAFAIGFQSSSAFTTAFTRVMGCSPRQFSRQTAQTTS
jgi:AraC-like DNA-binding protein